jgi:zinc D-Ala-D-Ala carboxypeptidase
VNKRAFLEGLFTASTVLFGGHYMWRRIHLSAAPLIVTRAPAAAELLPMDIGEFKFTPLEISTAVGEAPLPVPVPAIKVNDAVDLQRLSDEEVGRYLTRIRNFDAVFANDIYLDPRYEQTLLTATQRLARLESHIGHGNFNLIGFDEMLNYARNYSRVGKFETMELEFIEDVFFTDPTRYGFFGHKVTHSITDLIPRDSIEKIPQTGHFLLKGESLDLYSKIKADVGDQLVLTSGIRSVVKQLHLFIAKTIIANGNLSRASRSLAPPGHSYHGVGDFDVGKFGFGEKNFTSDFSSTPEYQKMAALAYVNIRYPTDNLFGVRFEPWHIKIS